ncbi:MAG: acyl carrier protein [Nitrospinaceae bacterium]
MDNNEIISSLTDFFEREFPNPGVDLTPSTNLTENWFLDSFGILNTVLFLEKNFGIEINRADINPDNFHSVESLSRFVQNQLSATQT